MSYSLAEIAKYIDAELVIHVDNVNLEPCPIQSIATLANAKAGQVAFLANKKYISQLTATQASAVIVQDSQTDSGIDL